MTKPLVTVLAVSALLLFASLPAAAQTTGRLAGEVKDPDGSPIPGVTLTISSEALPGGARVTVSGANGSFRVSALPPGNYDVVAEMEGFRTENLENLRVGINTTATANFVLHAEFAEALVVSSEAPLVDITSSAEGSSYSADFFKDLPTNRSFTAMMQVSPGVSQSSEDSTRTIAFGANMQSNTWHIDGLEASAPETGASWIDVNPDAIEEIQVLGIGAPAEYGNMLGAAFNVVTKSGTNQLKGSFSAYYQDDVLTDSGDDYLVEESEFQEWTRQEFWDLTATLGGPIRKDKLWFFAAYEYWRDNFAWPGIDPEFVRTAYFDNYDLKLSTQLGEKSRLDLKGTFTEWGFPEAYPNATPDATTTGEHGEDTLWAFNFQSIFSDRTFMEVRYSGWETWDDYLSLTGAMDPFIDYSPPGGGPPLYSGGITYPWMYETGTQQGDVTISHYADDFFKGEHDFKFGVRYGEGFAETIGLLNGHYTYRYEYYPGYPYYYRIDYQPYYYGNDQTALSAFVDDSWNVNDRLTVNLGVRYDRIEGIIPDFPEVDSEGNLTGATIPGIDPVFTWNNVSPRLGFAYNAGANRKTVVRGSFGVYYDGNVGGNWNAPPPGAPEWTYSYSAYRAGPYSDPQPWFQAEQVAVDSDLDAPRTLQYALGFERQLKQNYAFGATVIFKDTTDLIGFQNLGDGIYEEVAFTDPFTGRQYTLLNEIVQSTIIRGNQPGFTAIGFLDEYWQEYWGVLLTFDRRFAGKWGMKASYTWSESTGLIPRMLSQTQFNPPYGFIFDGRDPNNFINAREQHLQGDREHMLRLQGNFELPWSLHAHANVNFQSGRPYSRQIRVFGLGQGRSTVIMEPASEDQRHPFQSIVDLSIGRRFKLGGDGVFKLDVQIFNLFNDDASDSFQTLRLQEGDVFLPDWWVYPRRIMLRAGAEF